MPNFEKNLRQTATYWVQTGTDMFNKPTFSAPVQLACRWEDVAELYIDKRGQEVHSKSRVFFAQDIALEGYLLKGITAAASPLEVNGAYEVRQRKIVPDLRNLKNLVVAWL